MGTAIPYDQGSRKNRDADWPHEHQHKSAELECTRGGLTGTSTTLNYPSDRSPSGLDADMDRRTQSDLDRWSSSSVVSILFSIPDGE
jgi:hypothetical protein